MRTLLSVCCALATLPFTVRAEEQPCGKGMTEANLERLVLDSMEDVSRWANGSPLETRLSRSERARGGKYALLFANRIDYTQGEKNYPIGWPRTNCSLLKARLLTDWSAYDRFECWIHVDTSRDALPKKPLGISFAHPGHRRSTHVELDQVQKGQWVQVVIPISRLDDRQHVESIQFHISESNYQHGDRVDFYISGMALARFVEPAVNEFELQRQVVYDRPGCLVAGYSLVGTRGMDRLRVELSIGQGEHVAAKATAAQAARRGEVELPVSARLAPGPYWAQLDVRDAAGRLVDRRRAQFQVIPGPF
jgi:hypothetical protein